MKELYFIKKLISNGEIEKSIKTLLEFMEDNSLHTNIPLKSVYDEVILLSGRLKVIDKKIRLGIIDRDNEQLEKNKISYNLLNIINDFPKTLPKKNSSNENPKLTNRIQAIKQDSSFDYDIFLSFSSKDLKQATELWELLIGYGFRVFISSEYFKRNIGASFQKEIEFALEQSKNFLLLWTEDSKKSKWVEIEYLAFFNEFYLRDGENNRNIYVLREHKNSKVKLPLFLRNLQIATTRKSLLNSIIDQEERDKGEGNNEIDLKYEEIKKDKKSRVNINPSKKIIESKSNPIVTGIIQEKKGEKLKVNINSSGKIIKSKPNLFVTNVDPKKNNKKILNSTTILGSIISGGIIGILTQHYIWFFIGVAFTIPLIAMIMEFYAKVFKN